MDIIAAIQAQKDCTAARIAALVPVTRPSDRDGFPIQAWMGTMWMRSAAGTIIEFYNYIDPAYVHGPLYESEDVHITRGYFHTLARPDRAFFKQWDDFTLYDTGVFHALVDRLLRAGFQIMVDGATKKLDHDMSWTDYPDEVYVCSEEIKTGDRSKCPSQTDHTKSCEKKETCTTVCGRKITSRWSPVRGDRDQS